MSRGLTICFYLTLSRWTDLVASSIISRVPGKCSKPYFVVLVPYYCFAMNRVYGVAVNAYIAIYIMFAFWFTYKFWDELVRTGVHCGSKYKGIIIVFDSRPGVGILVYINSRGNPEGFQRQSTLYSEECYLVSLLYFQKVLITWKNIRGLLFEYFLTWEILIE